MQPSATSLIASPSIHDLQQFEYSTLPFQWDLQIKATFREFCLERKICSRVGCTQGFIPASVSHSAIDKPLERDLSRSKAMPGYGIYFFDKCLVHVRLGVEQWMNATYWLSSDDIIDVNPRLVSKISE
jgi:hypothetical protein